MIRWSTVWGEMPRIREISFEVLCWISKSSTARCLAVSVSSEPSDRGGEIMIQIVPIGFVVRLSPYRKERSNMTEPCVRKIDTKSFK